MSIYDIWLQCVMGIGSVHAAKALERFGSSKAIHSLTPEQRKSCGVFTKGELQKLDRIPLTDAEHIANDCKKRNISIITISDSRYPERLRHIADPPLVLYYRGTFPDFDKAPVICIVGPRRISKFGEKSAYSLGLRLSRGGFIIVSGGALGGDTRAHLGALTAGGITVAVLACGLDYPYLPENEKLRGQIAENGCVISEMPPMYPAGRHTFPIRNRLLSGLSLGVVVVEAPKISGVLITASCALEQSRDVFVIPGNPGVKAYDGSNALLRDGAVPLLSAMDIFNEYSPHYPDKINIEAAYKPLIRAESKKSSAISQTILSKQSKMVYNNLNTETFYADDIYIDGINAGEILAALTELEISGYINALPGGRYTKNK